ncbi:uncharacterized protein VTP21DRAFT_6158, partial [Calcarisporiella thermophila]|uniref:uncharacterized protein n=1 Tax=Calcarisporiella thermophila TaxID=911321 RepID=UPI0037433B1A
MKNIYNSLFLASFVSLAYSAEKNLGRFRNKSFGPDLSNFTNYTTDDLKLSQQNSQATLLKSTPQSVATQFAREHLTSSKFEVKDAYRTDITGITHIYLRQVIDGLEVVNGDININVDKKNKIISYGNSFYRESTQKAEDGAKTNDKLSRRAPKAPIIDPKQALLSFAKHLNLDIPDPKSIKVEEGEALRGNGPILLSNVPFSTSNRVPVRKVLMHTDNGRRLHTVWELDVKMKLNWFHAYVDSQNGDVISMVDWVNEAVYQVFPLGVNDPSEGSRSLLVDPHDKIASPNGWHLPGNSQNSRATLSNNVYAQENLRGDTNLQKWQDKFRPSGGENKVFDFPLDLTKVPKTYLNASITNLFYWTNTMHDLFYRYGFNEVAGNFQEDNFGKGGKASDAVIAFAQDGSETNNAYFWTTPDGQKPTIQMFLWTSANPRRDGDLDSGIIVHEYSHGISTRLTGGPNNANCLSWGEAEGMGEGWGDFFATILRVKSNHNRNAEFSMGSYAYGENIHNYLYSTSKTTNPETYGTMDEPGYEGPHPKGS